MPRSLMPMIVLVLAVGGCSTGGYEPPSVAVSAGEVEAVQAAADDWESIFYDAWPDIGPATELWADDIVSNDPLNSEWVFEGAGTLVPIWDGMARYFSDLDWDLLLDQVPFGNLLGLRKTKHPRLVHHEGEMTEPIADSAN